MEIESSPKLLNSTEDSGFVSTSINQSSLDLTPITTFESTPYEPNHPSRKRKLSHISIAGQTPTLKSYIAASSTLNESSISHILEKCNLSTFTPNFYTPRPEFSESPKKKHHSEPTTPTKCEPEETEFYRLHTDSFHKTPTKCISKQRLGSPECNEILYGGELKTNSTTKTAVLRYDNLLKRHSPAKKRLFRNNAEVKVEFKLKGLVNLHKKYDPVKYFLVDRKVECVFEQIFPCLSDEDLYSFMRVCKEWKQTVLQDASSSKRLNGFLEGIRKDKENSFERRRSLTASRRSLSNTLTPENNVPNFMMNKDLREGQRRNKCPKCTRVSIVERNIGQCVHESCGYIYCLNCSSCSTTGPENFQDRCMQSRLVTTKPRLGDIPKRLSFLMDSSSSKMESSSYNDFSDNISPVPVDKERRHSGALSEFNRDIFGPKPVPPRGISLMQVVSIEHQKIEVMEPSSPPKIKNVACSSKSKKYLKRLLRN